MNERVVKNPNFKNNGEFHASLRARGAGTKDYPNTHTEVEYLGNGKFAASIGVGHRVFFDKADGNKPKKHKLTDERPAKDYVLIQSAKCCVEVYPYYAKYFDVQHEEVRLEEERWQVQRLFKEPDEWRDVDAYNPVITVEEYPGPAGDVLKVTLTYDTDYGALTVEYFQRDGNALKHNVTFTNTSGGTEIFRVLQRWAGIIGTKCNGEDFPLDTGEPFLAFHRADKPKREFTIAENLWGMVFNPDGSEKTEKCLQRPIRVEIHAQGMKCDFCYGNWVLAQNESLGIDPSTATLDNPTEDGYLLKYNSGSAAACLIASPTRNTSEIYIYYGGEQVIADYRGWRSYVEWPISTLAGETLTANPVFKYYGTQIWATAGKINPLTEGAPSGATDANLWDYIASGIAYVDPFDIEAGADKQVDLGASAKTDLQDAMDVSQSWFAIGVQSPDDECPETGVLYSSFYSEEAGDGGAPPTLYVEYTPPAVGLENKSANMAAKMVAAGLI